MIIPCRSTSTEADWPPGMRVIVRKERPHPGAQLRFTDRDGLRLTAFATNTCRGQLPELELRHRRRARCEYGIRTAKDTGLTHLTLHDFDANQIWIQIVCPDRSRRAALGGQTATATAVLGRRPAAHHARRTRLRFATHWPFTDLITTALTRLQPG
jgi:hypothetical protein